MNFHLAICADRLHNFYSVPFSIDVYTSAGYMLRIDCLEAEAEDSLEL